MPFVDKEERRANMELALLGELVKDWERKQPGLFYISFVKRLCEKLTKEGVIEEPVIEDGVLVIRRRSGTLWGALPSQQKS